MNTALFLLLAGAVLVNVRPLRTRILPFTPMVWTRDSVDLREGKGSGPGIADPALMLELIAVMFLAGSTVSGALRQLLPVLAPAFQPILVRVSAGLEMGGSWREVWAAAARDGVPAELSSLEHSLRFVAQTGAPAAGLLKAEAARLRRERRRSLQAKAAALGVQLVLPLGLCALPAFICWAVVPIVIAIMPAG